MNMKAKFVFIKARILENNVLASNIASRKMKSFKYVSNLSS